MSSNNPAMKRSRFGGIADIITVDDAAFIRALAADELIDPRFVLRPAYNPTSIFQNTYCSSFLNLL
jgi:hypothetical protein